jgi:hypothetical protein
VDPGVFDVVDFEFHVWGRERGLVGAQVVADDLGWEVRTSVRGGRVAYGGFGKVIGDGDGPFLGEYAASDWVSD